MYVIATLSALMCLSCTNETCCTEQEERPQHRAGLLLGGGGGGGRPFSPSQSAITRRIAVLSALNLVPAVGDILKQDAYQ